MNVFDLRIPAGTTVDIPVPSGHNTLVVALHGKIALKETGNSSGELNEAQVAYFSREEEGIRLEAKEDAIALILTGEPIEEPVVTYGPFVMNTESEIHQALADYRSGKMGKLPSPKS
jgi:redox-sensitive bicupin YhaK (pirin superfamily)